jgi:ribosome-associated protein
VHVPQVHGAADGADARAGQGLPSSPAAPTTRASTGTSGVSSRQFAIEAARMLADTRCHNVAVLDVSGVSPVTDFFVLATGTSPRQMKSASDAVEEMGEPLGFRALSRVGDDSGNWILLDCVDVVVHVFSQDARSYYDLDSLWGDAKRVKWEREGEGEGSGGVAQ